MTATPQPAAVIHPQRWPKLTLPLKRDEELEARVEELLAHMTPAQKAGQLIQADIGSITPDDLRHYPLGSILNGGNSSPRDDKLAAPSEWLALADRFYDASAGTRAAPQVPALWGTDAVHGHNNIPGATIFPHNIGLGAARDPELIRRIGEITALEVRVTGLDWAFSPTVAVARDTRWGRTYESYSENPQLVRQYAAAMVEGLQGTPGTPAFLDGAHVLATPKHFLGDGGTLGKDQGDNLADGTRTARHRQRRLPVSARRRCADRDGVLLELAGAEDARQPCAADGRPQGAHGIRWLRARGLERSRTAAGLHAGQLRGGRECGTRHAHGARWLEGTAREPHRPGRHRADPGEPPG